jgi:glycosyltransferase involved in cell wall biosynthesis
MIKVCHIVNLITGKSDGVYAHLKMIFRNSDKTKFQHYLIFQGGENIEKELAEMGVKVFVSSSLKKKISIKAFTDIYRILKSNNIDIIHTHLIKPYAIAGLVNLILRKKFIFNYHGLFIAKNPYYNFIERSVYSLIHKIIYLFGRVDTVLVPSGRSKELLLKETKLFPEPAVYYNGYSLNQIVTEPDTELLNHIQRIKKNKKIIALIGRLEVDKRIDRAINIFNKIITHQRNIHLLIFGDGKIKSDLQKLVYELQLKENVDIFGYVNDIQNYFTLFDLVLFTSDWEGMPLTMWEAMANKVPVVAPDVGGFKEILLQNNCGLIYEPGNLSDAEGKILQLLDDEKLRIELGENGRAAIDTNYNEKKFIDQIEKIYFDLSVR